MHARSRFLFPGLHRTGACPVFRPLAVLLALALAAAAANVAAQDAPGFELGAVVDVRRPSDAGLRVLAVSPGGAADRIGMRAGDLLQEINGQPLAGVPRPAPALAQSLDAGAGTLEVLLVRAGERLTLTGPADIRGRDGGACGQITALFDGLQVPAILRKVDITQIEGRAPSPAATSKYALPAGPRVVIVREHLPQPASRPLSTFASKAFVIDVAADTTHYIGAMPAAGGGWVPYVWQSSRESCR